MAKKKNKQILRPWCWYCEREFEDEKVLMQHQKAKHFKCNMCPRRLNTAGGLAVHIQQVHKLEPESLPRIENALPGRDGYEVEIFGMEGIPAPDVADYKRRKEIELGLNPGTITQPQAKRPKVENRPLSEDELKAQLEAHKALMGASEVSSVPSVPEGASGAVYAAPSQTYAAPPTAVPTPVMSPPGIPPVMPPGAPPFVPGVPPPGFPGQPPFPLPGMPLPPGMPPPPGFPAVPPPFAGQPPPGLLPPGAPPFPPGVRPPFPPPFFPPGMPPPGIPLPGFSPPPGVVPPGVVPPMPGASSISPPGVPGAPAPPGAPNFVPSTAPPVQATPPTQHQQQQQQSASTVPPTPLVLPNPSLAQVNPTFKKDTVLKWSDPNFSPEERRSRHPKYFFPVSTDGPVPNVPAEEMRGKKRARAEDFL
ncbi:hypothetical protein BD310DRAFT_938128 [Dichomitus squalens]|uniref:C2H2-type domain-containing protein n=1 Tax=Dichomitus squalens TaxID=114155 RepID=A0A4Q9PGB5_9APHY|nr:hypothetical protein BD310DRAFT_938128 [Dichomitus squalens]